MRFTQPVNQIITMMILVGLVSVGTYFAYPAVSPIFLASPYLNGVIILVFLAGLISCFWQVFTLIKSVNWIEGFAFDRPGHDFVKAPNILASLAAMLSERAARFALTSTSTRSILDSVATRLDEGREITRYIINLLIFLGLLGTFYGLATTIPAVVDTIRSLAPQEGDSAMGVFDNLMTGLEAQLGGMGTAFGSSLLGLAGSLIVGLLDLFSGRGQNRFYGELEEWLSSITKLGSTSDGGDAIMSAGLFESASIQMEGLQVILAQTAGRMDQMANAVEQMIEHANLAQSNNAQSLSEIARGQSQIVDAIARMQAEGDGILDAETRMRLRSMDGQLSRMLEEMAAGRAQGLSELRSDLSLLNKNIAQLGKR
ncbi:biopolymer transporter ExbB [Paramylibacter kogurei]|uniref:biopolymer transporter ExbB n=1 Tax=Paramylibacter kogurei TaxID=1889778 RepID=UPI0030B8555F